MAYYVSQVIFMVNHQIEKGQWTTVRPLGAELGVCWSSAQRFSGSLLVSYRQTAHRFATRFQNMLPLIIYTSSVIFTKP